MQLATREHRRFRAWPPENSKTGSLAAGHWRRVFSSYPGSDALINAWNRRDKRRIGLVDGDASSPIYPTSTRRPTAVHRAHGILLELGCEISSSACGFLARGSPRQTRLGPWIQSIKAPKDQVRHEPGRTALTAPCESAESGVFVPSLKISPMSPSVRFGSSEEAGAPPKITTQA